MSPFFSASAWLLAPLLLAGCSVFRAAPEPEPTLADLPAAQLPDTERPLPRETLTQVEGRYRQALDTADPAVRAKVGRRLADLKMLGGEQRQLAGPAASGHFGEAIAAYNTLLAAQPGAADNDRLLYQLAKAYDMDGRSDEALSTLDRLVREYPRSVNYVEAQFRRAELLFARADYAAAQAAYGEVVARGAGGNYYQNALYMQGWTRFKRADYEAALVSFTTALDALWPADKSLEQLPRVDAELANDTLRVMSLAFSYLDGAATITATYRELGERHYLAALYDQLGQLYLQQKRYRDAADTYRDFVEARPQAPQAPAMYGRLIDAYVEGNFPTEVLTEKAAYAQRYGIRSAYWAQADEPARGLIRVQLKLFLAELARYHHATAQQRKAALAQPQKPQTDTAAPPTRADMLSAYREAADYYRQYIDTFPQDAEVGNMMFLLAESRFEAEDYAAAIDAYEAAAYQYQDHARGAEAGYSAILAYDAGVASLDAAQRPEWLRRKIGSELRFAARYPQDARAAAVQTHAAEALFEAKDFPAAIAAATTVTGWQPPPALPLRRSAWLVIGHGEFEQQHYAEAERGYREAAKLTPAGDPGYAPLQERLAAAVYKQAEQRLAEGDRTAAAREFLRVGSVAPGASIRANAEYDAATQLMEGAQWGEAITVLNGLRARVPQHALSAGAAAKLAVAYQQSGQPAAAAAELSRVAEQDGDPQTRREALLQAAELYRQSGDRTNAAARYRRYVELYPQPFGPALEARWQLVELSAGSERRTWLEQLVAADAGAGAQRNDRSRYLGARAQDALAEEAYQAFTTARLTLPLKASLQRKQAALEQALQAYRRTADYGVQEFATKAAFRIGEIYAGLSRDLLQSERPQGLSELELEQYEVLLEEEAYPFEEKAIAVHEGNTRRSRDGVYDEWVQRSFTALAQLLPARYRKPEIRIEASAAIY